MDTQMEVSTNCCNTGHCYLCSATSEAAPDVAAEFVIESEQPKRELDIIAPTNQVRRSSRRRRIKPVCTW